MFQFLLNILRSIFGQPEKIPTDNEYTAGDDSLVQPETSGQIGGKPAPQARWYMTPEMINLLSLIRKHESGKAGYNSDYGNNDKWNLVSKTFNEVRALSRFQVTGKHEASSAIGGYQFLTKTLDYLKGEMRLSGDEIFNAQLQDDLAIKLMIRRGLMKYLRGEMRDYTFANNLAKEWASLPVVTPIRGAHRDLDPGQSYYSGDRLNRAFHRPEIIMDAVRALRTTDMIERAKL